MFAIAIFLKKYDLTETITKKHFAEKHKKLPSKWLNNTLKQFTDITEVSVLQRNMRYVKIME